MNKFIYSVITFFQTLAEFFDKSEKYLYGDFLTDKHDREVISINI